MGEALLEQRARPMMKKIVFGNPFVVGDMASYDTSGISNDDSILMSVITTSIYTPGTATKTFQTGLSEVYAIGLCYLAYGNYSVDDMFFRFCINKNDFSGLSSGTVNLLTQDSEYVASCQYTVSDGDITLAVTNSSDTRTWKATYLFGIEVWGK